MRRKQLLRYTISCFSTCDVNDQLILTSKQLITSREHQWNLNIKTQLISLSLTPVWRSTQSCCKSTWHGYFGYLTILRSATTQQGWNNCSHSLSQKWLAKTFKINKVKQEWCFPKTWVASQKIDVKKTQKWTKKMFLGWKNKWCYNSQNAYKYIWYDKNKHYTWFFIMSRIVWIYPSSHN